jgi:hypothetical protein
MVGVGDEGETDPVELQRLVDADESGLSKSTPRWRVAAAAGFGHISGVDADDGRGSPGPELDARAGSCPRAPTRPEGSNEQAIGLYAPGITVRGIQTHIRETYEVEIFC